MFSVSVVIVALTNFPFTSKDFLSFRRNYVAALDPLPASEKLTINLVYETSSARKENKNEVKVSNIIHSYCCVIENYSHPLNL